MKTIFFSVKLRALPAVLSRGKIFFLVNLQCFDSAFNAASGNADVDVFISNACYVTVKYQDLPLPVSVALVTEPLP